MIHTSTAFRVSLLLVVGSLGDRALAANLPVIPVPAGYGHYCSVSDNKGNWAFEFGGLEFDPCSDILGRFKQGIIRRAGLWSERGRNNVMVRCGDQKEPVPYRVIGSGAAPINEAYNDNLKACNCIFIIAPTELPIFNHPWAGITKLNPPDLGVLPGETGFNYDVFNQPWDVTSFGQTPNPPGTMAGMVDRHGKSMAHFGSPQECASTTPPQAAGCLLKDSWAHAVEPAYDWSMDEGRPLLAMADGIVRGSRNRNVTGMCGANQFQAEIFIELQVGSGNYAERFVAAYHHMLKLTGNPTNNVQNGAVVHQGDFIARVGNTGCSGNPHLDLSIFRLTNLTGVRSYTFQALPLNANDPPSDAMHNKSGVNGSQGVIDPFGWSAPSEIDPYAWKFIGFSDPSFPNSLIPNLTEPGAYSIKLWKPGQEPPTY